MSDLAEQTAQLATLDAGWREMTIELRQWSNNFARFSAGKPRFSQQKWDGFAVKLQDKIDERHGPFGILSGVPSS